MHNKMHNKTHIPALVVYSTLACARCRRRSVLGVPARLVVHAFFAGSHRNIYQYMTAAGGSDTAVSVSLSVCVWLLNIPRVCCVIRVCKCYVRRGVVRVELCTSAIGVRCVSRE